MNEHDSQPARPADTGAPRFTDAQRYEIRVGGRLGPRWREWFDGARLTDDAGTTVIDVEVADQSALHGLLQRLRDLGIPLISVAPVAPEAPTPEPQELRTQEGS